jgi:hypothetical protein
MIAVFIGLCLYAVARGGRKALLMAVAITLGMACLVVWDAFFAPEAMQSHLGRFVGAKGMGVAELVTSKLLAHFRLMTTSAWGITALLSIWWWGNQHFRRNQRRLELSTCLAACLFLLNDSGPVSLTLFSLVMMFDHDSATFTGRWEQWTARVIRRLSIPKSI